MLRSDAKGKTSWIAYGLVGIVGVCAALLVAAGNPGNMGICGACFLRDTAGALGLFSNGKLEIFRPELLGVILGALVLTAARGKWTARSGSHAVTRLFFGAWMGIGSLVFLGCPFRSLQRLGGGDLNAAVALIGFVAGVGVGLFFEKRGYAVGKTAPVPAAVGLLGPLCFVGLLAVFLLAPQFLDGPGPGATHGPPHAFWLVALGLAVVGGALLAVTRYCAVSAARQVFGGDRRILVATGALVLAYGLTSLAAGNFNLGFDGQPAAHQDHLWSMLALGLVGLCGCLAGGCPVRQLVMTGEGNGDAFITVAGILAGGALAHNLGLAASGKGTTPAGQAAVAIGLVVAVLYAWSVTRANRSANGAS